MPLVLNEKVCTFQDNVHLKDIDLFNNDKCWLVWWYCGFNKNLDALDQPRILVAFREYYSDGKVSDDVMFSNIPLTALGKARIGTIWKKGKCILEVSYSEEIFTNLSFSNNNYKITSFHESYTNKSDVPYPLTIYPWKYSKDKNYLLEFYKENGGKVVVPCIEFFSRCYGRSEELKRILSIYPLHVAEDLIFSPLDEDEKEENNIWKIKLGKNLVNNDAVFCAHLKYDPYTIESVKQIYKQLEDNYTTENKDPIFIKVYPWYEGPAQLAMKGIRFNNGRSFLGLQIIGCNEPKGPEISRDRENTNKVKKRAEEENRGKAWVGSHEKEDCKNKTIIDITNYQDPDHCTSSVSLQDPDFIILGPHRVVLDKYREQAKSSAGKKIKAKEPTSYSAGERYGTTNNIGYVSTYAQNSIASNGILNDMWNAIMYHHNEKPTLIQKVEWFTFADKFSKQTPAHLIPLSPFSTFEKIPNLTRNWIYLNQTQKKTKGILVVRIALSGMYAYIIEIQRKKQKNTTTLDNTGKESSQTGLVFTLNNENSFSNWIDVVIKEIRNNRGIMTNLITTCPGYAQVFKHTKSQEDKCPCYITVYNALKKIGIKI